MRQRFVGHGPPTKTLFWIFEFRPLTQDIHLQRGGGQPLLRDNQKIFFLTIHIFFFDRNGIMCVHTSQKVCSLPYYPLFFSTIVELRFQESHYFLHHHHFNCLIVSANECQMEELLKKHDF